MNEATFAIPGPILDMLAQGLREMGDPPRHLIHADPGVVHHVYLVTDAGDGLLFARAQEMERT